MKRRLYFRTHPAPSLVLPLNVRSAGEYLLDTGTHEIRGPGHFLQMFWCTEGGGHARFGKRKYPLRPGSVFFYGPGEKHHLESTRSSVGYRWLTLDGPNLPNVLGMFQLKRDQISGPCPARLFEELEPCLQDATVSGERKASVLAYEILLLAAIGHMPGAFPEHQEKSAHLAKVWIEEHFMDGRLNIAALSARFGIHRSTLYRIFMKTYGVSPVQYLSRIRIRAALDLLKNDALTVADVAVRAGIPDLSYFSKQVRKHTGFSPRAYREVRLRGRTLRGG